MHCHVYAPKRRKRSAPDPLAGAVGPPDIEFRAGAVVSKPDAKGDKRSPKMQVRVLSAQAQEEPIKEFPAQAPEEQLQGVQGGGHLPASAPEEHMQGVPQGVG